MKNKMENLAAASRGSSDKYTGKKVAVFLLKYLAVGIPVVIGGELVAYHFARAFIRDEFLRFMFAGPAFFLLVCNILNWVLTRDVISDWVTA